MDRAMDGVKSPQAFISSLPVAHPPVDFSPYSWIFLHIHE